MTDPACLFCKIVAGEVPAQVLYQDDKVLAFRDIRPVAPTHVLIIPREHFAGLNEAKPEHHAVLGHALAAVHKVASVLGVADSGYRTVINTGSTAGQTVFHLHLHLLGGRNFEWPPG